jgi:ABC-type uncharacterized transport system ATPase component
MSSIASPTSTETIAMAERVVVLRGGKIVQGVRQEQRQPGSVQVA